MAIHGRGQREKKGCIWKRLQQAPVLGWWCWNEGHLQERKKRYNSKFFLGEIDKLGDAHLEVACCDQTSPKDSHNVASTILPPLTSFEPNQNPWTNIAIVTNCAAALVIPYTVLSFVDA